MNTALFLLRCIQIGLTLSDLDTLEHRTVMDMIVESANDKEEYMQLADQSDFDRF